MRLRDRLRDLNRTLRQHKRGDLPYHTHPVYSLSSSSTSATTNTNTLQPLPNRPTTTEHAPTRSPPRMPSPVKLRRIQTPSPGASYGTPVHVLSSPLEPRPSSSALHDHAIASVSSPPSPTPFITSSRPSRFSLSGSLSLPELSSVNPSRAQRLDAMAALAAGQKLGYGDERHHSPPLAPLRSVPRRLP